MKRILALLLILILTGSVWAALADTQVQAVTYNLGGGLDRVKLRDKPSTNGKVLGQYFSGVFVQVLEEKGAWWRVLIAGREGFMMRKFLTKEIGGKDLSNEGADGLVSYPERDGTVPIYDKPGNTSKQLALAEVNSLVRVLGTANEKWLHVRYDIRQEKPVYGYMSSDCVTLSDYISFVVDTGAAEKLLELKTAPDNTAGVIGRYFSGTRVSALFDHHTNNDGWERVRIGDAVGYMKTKGLDDSSGGTHDFYPPLSYALQMTLPLFDRADAKEAADSLSQNEAFSVLGIRGERYYIRIETEEPFQYRYGYVQMRDVQNVTRSASAVGTVQKEQLLYFLSAEGKLVPSEFTAPAGAKAYLFGSFPEGGQGIRSSCIDPAHAWLSCEVEMEPYYAVQAIIPRDAVTYDQALEYPAVPLRK